MSFADGFVCCVDFCVICGDCLHCYWEDPCIDGEEHVAPNDDQDGEEEEIEYCIDDEY